MYQKYSEVTQNLSKLITRSYSTSFSMAVGFLGKEKREAIYNLYGFVRLADEIVDSFHQFDQKKLLDDFEKEYDNAYNFGISLNPILHAFQQTVKKYNIDDELIRAFLESMKVDLYKKIYHSKDELNSYIYGSADVVGLMCLKIFSNGDEKMYNELKFSAMHLGSAFQKVNFLRDLKNDKDELNRSYFPQFSSNQFTEENKNLIINEINNDFKLALQGIKKLPNDSKFAVYLAYIYYKNLLTKINHAPIEVLLLKRVRISNFKKFNLIFYAFLISQISIWKSKLIQLIYGTEEIADINHTAIC